MTILTQATKIVGYCYNFVKKFVENFVRKCNNVENLYYFCITHH